MAWGNDEKEPKFRAARCRRCMRRPCSLTEKEVAALVYLDEEGGTGRSVCTQCQQKKIEEAGVGRSHPDYQEEKAVTFEQLTASLEVLQKRLAKLRSKQ